MSIKFFENQIFHSRSVYTKNIFIISNLVAITTLALKHIAFPILSLCVNISNNHYVRYIQAKDSYRSALLVVPFANFYVYQLELEENAELTRAKLREKLDPYQLLYIKNFLKQLSQKAKENFLPLAHKFNLLETSECEMIRNMYSNIERYNHSYPTIPDNEMPYFDELFHFLNTDKQNQEVKGNIYILLPSLMCKMNPQYRVEHLVVFTNLAKSLAQNKLNILSHIFAENLLCNIHDGYIFNEIDPEELQIFMQTVINRMKPETPEKEISLILESTFDLVKRATENVSTKDRQPVMKTILHCSVHLDPQKYANLLLNLIKEFSTENHKWIETALELAGSLARHDFDYDPLKSLIISFQKIPSNEVQNFYELIKKCKSQGLSLWSLSQIGKMLERITAEKREKFIDDLLSIKLSYPVSFHPILDRLHALEDPIKAIKKVLEFPEISKHGHQDGFIECIVQLSPFESKEFILKFITDKTFGADNLISTNNFFTFINMDLKRKQVQELLDFALAGVNAGVISAKLNLTKINLFYLGNPMFSYVLAKITGKYELFDSCRDQEKQKIIEIAEFFNDTTMIGKLKTEDPLSTPFFKEFPSLLPNKTEALVEKMVNIPNEVYHIFSSENDFYSLSRVSKAFQEKFSVDYPKKLIIEIQDLQKQIALSKRVPPEEKDDINMTSANVIKTLENSDLANCDLEKLKEFLNTQKMVILNVLNKHKIAEVLSVTGLFSIIRYCRQRELRGMIPEEVLVHQLTNEHFHYHILNKSKSYDLIKMASGELKQKVKALAEKNKDQEVLDGLREHQVI